MEHILLKINKLLVYDLDETIITSSHRQCFKPDGTLDLEHWRENCTPEMIAKDKLLPLANHMRQSFYQRGTFVTICTSRVMQKADWQYLNRNGLNFHYAMHRQCPTVTTGCADLKKGQILDLLFKLGIPAHRHQFVVHLYDDHVGVLNMSRSLGFNTYDSITLNKRMA